MFVRTVSVTIKICFYASYSFHFRLLSQFQFSFSSSILSYHFYIISFLTQNRMKKKRKKRVNIERMFLFIFFSSLLHILLNSLWELHAMSNVNAWDFKENDEKTEFFLLYIFHISYIFLYRLNYLKKDDALKKIWSKEICFCWALE